MAASHSPCQHSCTAVSIFILPMGHFKWPRRLFENTCTRAHKNNFSMYNTLVDMYFPSFFTYSCKENTEPCLRSSIREWLQKGFIPRLENSNEEGGGRSTEYDDRQGVNCGARSNANIANVVVWFIGDNFLLPWKISKAFIPVNYIQNRTVRTAHCEGGIEVTVSLPE